MVDKDARKNGSAGRTSKKWTVGDYLRLLLGLGLLVGLVWYLPGLALAAAVVLAVLIPIMILSERFSGSVGPRIPVLGKVAGAAIVLAFFGGETARFRHAARRRGGVAARGAGSTARNPLPVIGFIRTTSSQDYTRLVPVFRHRLGEMGLTRRFVT
jgi:hypothetical protein